MKTHWNKTTPPKRTTKPVRLQVKDPLGHIFRGDFVWCNRENTWVECCDHPDGVGLYEEDGWVVLGWI